MSHELPSFLIDAGELLQHVSRIVYRGSPLYYGRSGTNRYDDPARDYGVLYLGRDLPTALMESVFHKHQWLADTERSIALKEVKGRMVRAVGVMADVLLADLTAPGIMAGYFGLNLEQLANRNYTHTQKVSAQVHAVLDDDGQPLFDGLLYPSRNNYPDTSIALFERAGTKVSVIEDIDLVDHVDWPRFVAAYRIGVEPDPGPVEPDEAP
ncbi:RES family NAD+ phosphorylase [Burkholderia cenocepacia]|uniref:RES family NAD+ phosphorylase n=1 Tax=Burkholderia cenocepacia TaxID=95486 RepID=A0ABD4UI49_9BURK|nr:RES family NAD+ phosphorylase [Burkholderia cenocepacia]MCW3662519.1 RES family NAD+ phosphorylase [Burkholderia cenocepacia]MCW3697931.1 RES family NAD+ phosphorylase [Burkholderia cenocepacia]MCW3705652.1 RES family NAD+ phosphorylase [Burkholderia cenocepacia]MCW3714017.1 RES family NAD+ phosphorylase [Burkholderia cenocepacia]MCW3722091.1 RES family NAD+ phosphorylase [Burkholderia cenocepacia]